MQRFERGSVAQRDQVKANGVVGQGDALNNPEDAWTCEMLPLDRGRRRSVATQWGWAACRTKSGGLGGHGRCPPLDGMQVGPKVASAGKRRERPRSDHHGLLQAVERHSVAKVNEVKARRGV